MPFEIRSEWIAAVAIALLGGTIRGLTGFGGAMAMTPALVLFFEPRFVVPVVLLLETFAGAPMVPAAIRIAHWKTIAPIAAGACATVPLGGYVLLHADPDLLRRAIAVIVLVFAIVLLAGVRYTRPHRVSAGVGLGCIGGVLLGSTSVGGPPVIMYLVAGPDTIAVTRANLTLYVIVTSIAGLVMLGVKGALDAQSALSALALAPFFLGGVVAGSRLFRRVDERRVRRFILLLMVAMALTVLAHDAYRGDPATSRRPEAATTR